MSQIEVNGRVMDTTDLPDGYVFILFKDGDVIRLSDKFISKQSFTIEDGRHTAGLYKCPSCGEMDT